ncbi:unnamed protein product, partial [Ectocarpus sp. 13 AM-2016]
QPSRRQTAEICAVDGGNVVQSRRQAAEPRRDCRRGSRVDTHLLCAGRESRWNEGRQPERRACKIDASLRVRWNNGWHGRQEESVRQRHRHVYFGRRRRCPTVPDPSNIHRDAAKQGVMVDVRRFRLAAEVDGQPSTYLTGTDLIRAWEQQDDGKTAVRREAIDGPYEMYTAAEVADKVHEDERANEAPAEQDARRYFAEGFVVPKPPPEGGRRRRKQALDDGNFSVKCDRWSPEGTPDDPKFNIRKSEFVHNVENHPAAMLPLVQYIDGFNANGMQTKASSWKRCKCMW